MRLAALLSAAGRACQVVTRPGLALDLDTPVDVALLLAGQLD